MKTRNDSKVGLHKESKGDLVHWDSFSHYGFSAGIEFWMDYIQRIKRDTLLDAKIFWLST